MTAGSEQDRSSGEEEMEDVEPSGETTEDIRGGADAKATIASLEKRLHDQASGIIGKI
jgi:hypothetical protein